MIKNPPHPFLKDRWLIMIILIIVAVSAWNSRHTLFPPPRGYTRFDSYGISFLYPEGMYLWQEPINDDGSESRDGTRTVSENWGDAGWYSGNVETETSEVHYFQQSGVLWLAKQPEDPPRNLEPVLYKSQIERRETKQRDPDSNRIHQNIKGLWSRGSLPILQLHPDRRRRTPTHRNLGHRGRLVLR